MRPSAQRDLVIDSQVKFDKVLETIIDPNTVTLDKKLEAEIILSDVPKTIQGNPFMSKAIDQSKLFANLVPDDAGDQD